MPNKVVIGALLFGFIFGLVEPLATEASYNSHFDECVTPQTDQRSSMTPYLSQIPKGMTMNSFIDVIDKFERRLQRGSAYTADKVALMLLHWFSLPDSKFKINNGRFEQPSNHRFRYEFVKRLFSDEIASIAGTDFEHEILGNDALPDNEQDDACFLRLALSHSVNLACPSGSEPRNRLQSLAGEPDESDNMPAPDRLDQIRQPTQQQQSQYQNANTQRQRGRQPQRNLMQPANDQRFGSIPNLRSPQTLLQYPSQRENCVYREEGVVSISGRLDDSISVAPVLMGIAASKMESRGTSLFSQSDSLSEKDLSRINMEALEMGTLGQEIGFAAFLKKIEEKVQTDKAVVAIGSAGKWNSSGCLESFELDNRGNRRIALTKSQLAGAMDGFIIGKAMRGTYLDGISLSSILRLYYSNNQHVLPQSTNVRFSVCDRPNAYHAMGDTQELRQQARLMVYGLALKDGKVFGKRDYYNALTLDDPEIDSAVASVLSQINADETMRDLRDTICPLSQIADVVSCTPEVTVVLDTAVTNRADLRSYQAEILGAILNGVNFQYGRNAVKVYGGKSGTGLSRLPERVQNFTGSGCPACLAQYLGRYRISGSGSDDLRSVIDALNETFRMEAVKQSQIDRRSARPTETVLLFRMAEDTVRDLPSTKEALIRFRIANPQVELVIIGDDRALESMMESTGTFTLLKTMDFMDAIKTRPRGADSVLEKVKRIFCRSFLSIQPKRASLPDRLNRESATDLLQFGVEQKHAQVIGFEPRTYAGSWDMRVKFTSKTNGFVKVCDVSAGLDTALLNSQSSSSSNTQTSNRGCQQTSEILPSILFNYTNPCPMGPRSCSSLKFAVIGLTGETDGRGRQVSNKCRGEYCETPVSIQYTVETIGMLGSSARRLINDIILVMLSVLLVLMNLLYAD